MMSSDKYLVTSATGNTGFQVALLLLSQGKDVRVMSRSKGEKVQVLIQKGAEHTLGGIDDEQAMEKAMVGIDKVYYCYPIMPLLLQSSKMFAKIARKENIKAVVNVGQYLSALSSHPSKQTREHKLSYQVLDDANIGAMHVTPGWFADNALSTALFISQLSKFPFPLGKGRCPVVSNEDIAAVAVALLDNPEQHTGKRYQPTGPKALTQNDMLNSFEAVLGRKVSNLYMPKFLFYKAIIHMGFSPYLLSQLSLYIEDYQNGEFDYEPNNVVKDITGRDPEPFELTARRYFTEDALLNRTPQKIWQAIKEFIAIGFTRAPSRRDLIELNKFL